MTRRSRSQRLKPSPPTKRDPSGPKPAGSASGIRSIIQRLPSPPAEPALTSAGSPPSRKRATSRFNWGAAFVLPVAALAAIVLGLRAFTNLEWLAALAAHADEAERVFGRIPAGVRRWRPTPRPCTTERTHDAPLSPHTLSPSRGTAPRPRPSRLAAAHAPARPGASRAQITRLIADPKWFAALAADAAAGLTV